jgi:hypothetical protein
MSLFLNRYAEQAGDDLVTLLGDLQLMEDGEPTNPAAWSDWLSCVSDVSNAGSSNSRQRMTVTARARTVLLVRFLSVARLIADHGGVPDLRSVFTERDAEATRPGLLMTAVGPDPRLQLDPDAVKLLRAGLGRYDMDLRWLAHLDDSGTLRLWRSWTGHQIYEVTVVEDARQVGVLVGLKVEQHPERHRGRPDGEPDRFEAVLASVVNDLRRFRAGYTPYGAAPDADPEPAGWP